MFKKNNKVTGFSQLPSELMPFEILSYLTKQEQLLVALRLLMTYPRLRINFNDSNFSLGIEFLKGISVYQVLKTFLNDCAITPPIEKLISVLTYVEEESKSNQKEKFYKMLLMHIACDCDIDKDLLVEMCLEYQKAKVMQGSCGCFMGVISYFINCCRTKGTNWLDGLSCHVVARELLLNFVLTAFADTGVYIGFSLCKGLYEALFEHVTLSWDCFKPSAEKIIASLSPTLISLPIFIFTMLKFKFMFDVDINLPCKIESLLKKIKLPSGESFACKKVASPDCESHQVSTETTPLVPHENHDVEILVINNESEENESEENESRPFNLFNPLTWCGR